MAKFINLDEVPNGTSYEDVFRMFETRISVLESYITWDKELRQENPALQDLYEQYQTTKKLMSK